MLKKIKTSYLENKVFFTALITLLIPITLQNVISYALTTADTLMVGALGQQQLSAVSLANQPFSIYWCIMFGLISGGSILISQYWGKHDIKNINRFTGLLMALILGASLIFTSVCFFFPEQIMRIYSNDETIIKMGTEYLSMIAFSYLPTGISGVFLGVLRCTQQAKAPLIINAISLILNTILNALLIFGMFGAPNMGIKGAALATVIARAFEVVAAMIFIFVIDKRKVFNIKKMLVIKIYNVQEFFKYSLAVLINDVVWGVGISVHAMVLGRLGSSAVAAYTLTNLMEKFIFIVVGGMGSAVAVIIGKELGHGNVDVTKKYAGYILKIAVGTGLLFGLISVGIAPLIIGMFNYPSDTVTMAMIMIVIMAIIAIAKCFNYMTGVGLLRAGGDTKFMAILDISGLYLISIPLALLAAFVFKWPPYLVYLMLFTDELVKIVLYYKRYKTYIWARNITKIIE